MLQWQSTGRIPIELLKPPTATSITSLNEIVTSTEETKQSYSEKDLSEVHTAPPNMNGRSGLTGITDHLVCPISHEMYVDPATTILGAKFLTPNRAIKRSAVRGRVQRTDYQQLAFVFGDVGAGDSLVLSK